MVPEIQWQPSPYFEQLGIYRGQLNWSVGQNFSLVLLHELQSLEDHWENSEVLEEVYKKRALLKSEWSWNYGNQILGLTFGRERLVAGELMRAGGYASFTLDDAWQIYGDIVARETVRKGSLKTLSVGGLRYTFSNGMELRLEGINNDAGLTKAERQAQELLISRLPDRTLLGLSRDRAESLQGKHYVYGGFRWANPPGLRGVENPLFFLRALHALSDASTSLLGGMELGFGGRYTLAFYGALTPGPKDGELARIYRNLMGLTAKVAF
jgi:hypothetical protein